MSVVEGGLNYFTCTLAQAAQWKQENRNAVCFSTVIDLIDKQAEFVPQSPALGFTQLNADISANSFPTSVSTFSELRDLSTASACVLAEHVKTAEDSQTRGTIGLLCTSSLDFVLTWLGLTRLGYSALFLAPQLEPHAILHLCSETKTTIVFVDETHCHKISDLKTNVNFLKIPSYWNRADQTKIGSLNERRWISDVAYFVHSSGTSSGLPKVIPQSHQGLIKTLPCFPGDYKPATFTTTPLYHGGLVDCFRAWTSGAMIWLFPEGAGPITALSLQRGIKFARNHNSPDVKYFTSVPYVLQILAEEDYGLQILQSMDLVAVGGAALPAAIGDKLVGAGVHLLSRLGSAECGFLMSSHRDYSRDRAWQYFRPTTDTNLMSFEQQENGLSELIVKSQWPFKVKTNHSDNAYATSDLFEPHLSIPNAWRYHSRADSQITLANGKKFDPAPMEASILAANKMLGDVLVFGDGEEFAGVLLFPVSNELSHETVVDYVWPQVEEMNRSTLSHARISRSMLVVVKKENGQSPLKKSSKGTILRPQATKLYAKAIRSAYAGDHFTASSPGELCDENLSRVVMDCFARVLGREVCPDKDLYHQGVDSIASSQIRTCIETVCLPQKRLPMNVIYDQSTVNSLVTYLRRLRSGTQSDESNWRITQARLMRELTVKYSQSRLPETRYSRKSRHVIVLTGSTGFLGSHILDLLRGDCGINKIYCLVRAPTASVARARVSQALKKHGLPDIGNSQGSFGYGSKVVCLSSDLSSCRLGLSESDHQKISTEATIYVHAAWTVNFTLPLQSFENQVAATRYLVDMAVEGAAHFVFISSIAAVINTDLRPAAEKISTLATDAAHLGYAQSKWVAEQICAAANDSRAVNGVSLPQISIIRVGQLCGNDAGIWNASEAYPLMLSTAKLVNCLPNLNEVINWLPVDEAARAVSEIILSQGIQAEANTHKKRELAVYHVINPCKTPTWNEMLEWLSDEIKGGDFEVVAPSEWLGRLEDKLTAPGVSHPSQALLYFWKTVIDQNPNKAGYNTPEPRPLEVDTALARTVSRTMRMTQPLGRQSLIKMWKWITDTI